MNDIIPDSGGHVESYDCWCKPKLSIACDECHSTMVGSDPDRCWKCNGTGGVSISLEEAENSGEAVITVHSSQARDEGCVG